MIDVNKPQIIAMIMKHLNGEIGEAELVAWAEDAFVAVSEYGEDLPDEAVLLDLLGALGSGDMPGFALTWAALRDYLARLGVQVQVVAEPGG